MPYEAFSIQHSAFSIQHSAFSIQQEKPSGALRVKKFFTRSRGANTHVQRNVRHSTAR